MALLIYSVLRIVLVVGAGAVLYLLGLRSWLLVLGAVLLGAGLSYVLLEAPRRRAAESMAARRADGDRFSRALAEEAADEDAEADSISGADLAERARSGGAEQRSGGAEQEGAPEQEPEGELEEAGVLEHDDQVAPGGAAEDPARQDDHHRSQQQEK
jgi:hypothetical protein